MTFNERYTYKPPEGESWKTCERRLISAFNKSIQEGNHRNIVILTHGGTIRILMPYLLGVSKEESFKYDPSNASITEFEFNGKSFTPIRINDSSHLKN